MKLIQFKCGREGTLFYYQSAADPLYVIGLVGFCPVCGSKRVTRTGREYPPVDESEEMKEADCNP